MAPPLLLDRRWIEDARDVFPIEFLELREHHVLLHGETDPFADLPVNLDHLRLEVEQQLRGKLLHLWEAYLETRRLGAPAARAAARDAAGLRLDPARRAAPGGRTGRRRGATRRPSSPRSSDAFACRSRRSAGSSACGAAREHLASDELEALFEAYLAELRGLTDALDAARSAP